MAVIGPDLFDPERELINDMTDEVDRVRFCKFVEDFESSGARSDGSSRGGRQMPLRHGLSLAAASEILICQMPSDAYRPEVMFAV